MSVFAAGVLAMTGAASVTMLAGHAAAAGTPLFPNMQTLPPRDLRFADANVSNDPNVTTTHRVLQFSNTVTNSGAGRLEMRAHIDSTLNPPSGPAYQRVYDTAGGYTDYPAGSMYYHAVHQHYHYEGWGVYQLWTKADYDNWLKSGRTTGNPKWVGSKTTSCIIDEEFVRTLPGTPYPGQYGGGGCQLDSSGNLVEGLSPGWGDTYDWYRFEQWIDIGPAGSALADGAYVLRSVTDPNNQIYESAGKSDTTVESAADNEGTTVFTVSGSQILDTDAPTGTLAINHVAASTSVANVTASVVGRDDVSGVKAFRLSNDGTTWSPQIAYTSSASVATDASWSLTDSRYGGTAATGTKTVYAQFLDNSGKWGPSTTDTIVYGTATTSPPPTSPPPTSAYSSAVVADGPAGYWRLGETSGTGAADVKGTHTGSYVGGVSLGQPGLLTGDPDNAIATDGSTGFVRVPTATDLTAPAISVEAWIRPDAIPSAGGWASIASKAESYSLQFNGPLLEFTLINSSGTRARLQAPAGAVAVGGTYHVVGTYDGTTARLYVNGTQVASSTSGWAPAATTNPLTFGSWNGTEFFRGRIDEVAVYPKALTAARVSAHYSTGTTSGTTSGTPTPTPTTTSPTPTPTTTSASPTPTPTTTSASPTPTPTTTSPSPVTSAYSSAVTADGPAGFWRLGETSGTTAVDVKGTHNGSYVGGVSLGQPGLLTGDADKAITTDGSTGLVRVPTATDLTAPAISVEAWIRPDAIPSAGGWASIASKAESYSLQFNGPLLEFTLINSTGTRARLQAPAGAVAVGGTYHVVGTYDGTTARLYVNGTQLASSTSGWAPAATTNPLTFGSWNGSEFFRGRIDEVAVYPKALTAARVSAHYSTGTTSSTPTTTTATAGPATGTYPVTVTTSGTGTGTVNSSPAGISCPTTCSADFPASTSVTLTAAAAGGSTFSGWTGACTGTASTCTFSTYAATSVGAVFNSTASSSYQLAVTRGGAGAGSVASSPTGISCGSTCTASFASGTSVTLTASPAAGSVFAGWAGDCAGTSLTCTVTMSASVSVSATFQPAASQTLSVALKGNGSGQVTSSPAGISCGSSCSASFATGTKVTLTAAPASGSTFKGWNQGCSGSATTCVVILNGPLTVGAMFS